MRPFAPVILLLLLTACGGGGGAHLPVAKGGGNQSPVRTGSPANLAVKPYLQLGDAPASYDRLDLLWHAPDGQDGWAVEVRTDPQGAWRRMAAPTSTLVTVQGAHPVPPHRVWRAALAPLAPGGTFDYRVLQHGTEVFLQTGARARKAPEQPQRIVVVGDLAEGTPMSRAIAFRIQAQKADLMVGAGDLVYQNGTVAEYRSRFFPTYNADQDDPNVGAPIMRGTLMVGVLGNHDVAQADRDNVLPRDTLAYYYYWDQPLDGPDLLPGGHIPNLVPQQDWAPFRAAAGKRFPRMGNFTFRSGDVHWTVLDSNLYVHWQDKDVRRWLKKELQKAQDATWRFVVFHHAAFSLASFRHTRQWHMRQLWPIFQKYNVDLVFAAHLHTYQRTAPFRFTPTPRGVTDAQHCAQEANIVPEPPSTAARPPWPTAPSTSSPAPAAGSCIPRRLRRCGRPTTGAWWAAPSASRCWRSTAGGWTSGRWMNRGTRWIRSP
ncbi:MAG: metallophosphoesterase [Holophaga sp.]|jgi:3',5'-cyclic AMP phosphodiesterase CpdA